MFFSLLALGSAVALRFTPGTVFLKANQDSQEHQTAWSLFFPFFSGIREKNPMVSHPSLLTIRDISLHSPPPPLENILPPAFTWAKRKPALPSDHADISGKDPVPCARNTGGENPQGNQGATREVGERGPGRENSLKHKQDSFHFLQSKGFVQHLLK